MPYLTSPRMEPLILPHILHLPDAAYLNIVRYFDTLQEVWKFTSIHKLIKIKINRLLLSKTRCLMVGTEGRYDCRPSPLPTLTRQESIDNSGGLKSIIRTPASSSGDSSPPRQKYRVRFELEDAVWNYATPKMAILTASTAGLTRLGDCGAAADAPLPAFRRLPLCADRPSTSDAFNMFCCSYFEDRSDTGNARYIECCTDLFRAARRNLRELHIGPVKECRSGKALQKFLTYLTLSDVTLQKLVVTYDGESELYYQPPPEAESTKLRRRSIVLDDGSPVRSSGFPSRPVNCKLLKLVRRNGNTLNSVKVFLDEEFQHWVFVERRTVDGVCSLYVEHKLPDYQTDANQALHFYLDAFRYDNRTLASQTFFKIWARTEDFKWAATFCAMASISFECQDTMHTLIADLYITDAENSVDPTCMPSLTVKRRNQLLSELRSFVSTDSIIPFGLGRLETIEWRFHNVELTTDEFQDVCRDAKSFRNALTTFQIGKQAVMVASPAVAIRPVDHRTFITVP